MMSTYFYAMIGCGLAKESAEVLGDKIRGSSAALRWRQTNVLVIDESERRN